MKLSLLQSNRAIGQEAINFLFESNKIEGIEDIDSLKQAIEAWQYLLTVDELGVGDILKAHKILMLHHKLRPNERGYFRKCPVMIGGREGLSWPMIPSDMAQWVYASKACVDFSRIKQYKTVEENKNEIIENRIRNDHIGFEKIHPFVDGNGRIGRMLMNWQRIQCGLDILVIWDVEKQEYYSWFK